MPVLDPQIGKPYRYGNNHIFVARFEQNTWLTGTLFLAPAIYGHADKIDRFGVDPESLSEYENGDDNAS